MNILVSTVYFFKFTSCKNYFFMPFLSGFWYLLNVNAENKFKRCESALIANQLPSWVKERPVTMDSVEIVPVWYHW